VLLLKAQPSAQRWRRCELSRMDLLKLWAEKHQQGWQATTLTPKRVRQSG